MSTARKTYKQSPHPNYVWVMAGTHGSHSYTINHYQLLSQAAVQEASVTSPVLVGLDLYSHCTRNGTPTTWKAT